MISRFEGAEGKRRLVEAIRSQQIVEGDLSTAEALAECAELHQWQQDEVLITQDAEDNHLYLILIGSVDVIINRRKLRKRAARCHVGEMSLIDPSVLRSATVIASEITLTAKISEADFVRIASGHSHLWRALARELGSRLRERSQFIKPPNDKPVVFIGSSREALALASAVRDRLTRPEYETRSWQDGIFGASRYPMEDLEKQLAESDYAVLVASPDDLLVSRGVAIDSPRDNVIFEYGLFMGALSRERTFLLIPQAVDIKIPTDLAGLTTLRYDPNAAVPQNIEDACVSIESRITKLGPR